MSISGQEVRDRIRSVCAGSPFNLTEAQTPFDFSLQPSGEIDQVFRVEHEADQVIGGFSYTEEYTDRVTIWVARTHDGDPQACYQTLLKDAGSIRAAVIRDGSETSGEYTVPSDGAGMSLQRQPSQSYQVLRLYVPVNYENTV